MAVNEATTSEPKMIRRTPIRKVSKKRAKINREYLKMRESFLKEHPLCQWYIKENGLNEEIQIDLYRCGVRDTPQSQDIHHKKGRGKYLLDTSTWMAVSRYGHDQIHHNVSDSYQKGYMLPRNG